MVNAYKNRLFPFDHEANFVLCRLSQGYHQDTLEDAAAYIALAEMLKDTDKDESNEP